MRKETKFEPVFILLSLLLGYFFSFFKISIVTNFDLEETLVSILLFFIFLEIDWSDLKLEFKNKKFRNSTLIINFIWTPVFAFLLGKLFLSNDIDLQIALILILVMPCTDWYLIFTEMTGGNLDLSTSILPFNLILQLLLLPFYLYFFFGNQGYFIDLGLTIDTIIELLIPLVLAFIVRFILVKVLDNEHIIHKASDKIEFLLICIIAFVLFLTEGQDITSSFKQYKLFFFVLVVYYLVNFTLSFNLGKKLNFDDSDIISLVFATTSKNTPLSLTLAGILFPEHKIISLVLILGPLTELPFSLLESAVLKKLLPVTRKE